MGRQIRKRIELEPEDVQTLARARADGVSAPELIRRGLRIVAGRYYRVRRRPRRITRLISTAPEFGCAELFKHHRR